MQLTTTLLTLALLSTPCVANREVRLEQSLHAEIDALYRRSVHECEAFYPGQAECVKSQFALNYRWGVLRDQDRIAGGPGTPGPGSTLTFVPATIDSDTAKGAR
jgi:hypothetical protein